MSEFFNALIWTIVGIILDRIFEYKIQPKYFEIIKKIELKKMKLLYYGDKTLEFVKSFYSEQLYNCKIGKTSMIIPFLVDPNFTNIDINIIAITDILDYVNTNKCRYPIHNKMIKNKIKRGKKLFNNSSLFLHKINYYDGIKFEVGEYDYFQRISFVNDIEKETFNCAYHIQRNPKLRKKYLPNITNASTTAENTIPIGCDAVLIIKIDNEYKVCIHERSVETINYPNGIMIVPSFGFGSIKDLTNNPLLYSFLKEYSEEIFNREEVDKKDNHVNPYWFYSQYEEIKDILGLIDKNEFYLHLIGYGFDAISCYCNIILLAIIDDKVLSEKIYNTCKGNWETSNNNIKFVGITSNELEKIFQDRKMSPSTAFSISRTIQILIKDKRITP